MGVFSWFLGKLGWELCAGNFFESFVFVHFFRMAFVLENFLEVMLIASSPPFFFGMFGARYSPLVFRVGMT